jgi:hypothetical protein
MHKKTLVIAKLLYNTADKVFRSKRNIAAWLCAGGCVIGNFVYEGFREYLSELHISKS